MELFNKIAGLKTKFVRANYSKFITKEVNQNQTEKSVF